MNPATGRLFADPGEAAPRIPQAHGGAAWRRSIGLRNKLAHGDRQFDQALLHRMAAADLPAVPAGLATALAERDRA